MAGVKIYWVKWGRSDDGNVESKCGRFEIEARFNHSTRPQAFVGYFKPKNGPRVSYCYANSQREAREEVLGFARRFAHQLIRAFALCEANNGTRFAKYIGAAS